MIRKYHDHKPQTTPWHHEEEPLNHHETPGRQIKQSLYKQCKPQLHAVVVCSVICFVCLI